MRENIEKRLKGEEGAKKSSKSRRESSAKRGIQITQRDKQEMEDVFI